MCHISFIIRSLLNIKDWNPYQIKTISFTSIFSYDIEQVSEFYIINSREFVFIAIVLCYCKTLRYEVFVIILLQNYLKFSLLYILKW